jgi:Tol biopolymer transport system component
VKRYVLLLIIFGLILAGCENSEQEPQGELDKTGNPEILPTSAPTSTPIVPTPTPVPCLFAFASGSKEVQNIYVMDGNGGDARPLNTHDGMDGHVSWSPDGAQIVFDSRRAEQWDIYIMNTDGTNETQLTFSEKASRHPSFSPDGTQIVYGQTGDDDKHHLFIMDKDGGNQRQLTFGGASEYDPVWSPDGSQIVYYSDANWASGLFEIFVIDANGGDPQQLTDDAGFDWNCGWLPDGSKIYFVRNSTLVTMDTDGSNLAPILEADVSFPSFSPDGSQIAFMVRGDDESTHIFIIDADGSNPRQFTMIDGSQWSGSWSPGCK